MKRKQYKAFESIEVQKKYFSYPKVVRYMMMQLREIILDVAKNNKKIGVLEETLKWNEPSYIPSNTKSGSMVRIDWKKTKPSQYVMYFHCKTKLVSIFKEKFPEVFVFDGNRAIIFSLEDKIRKNS